MLSVTINVVVNVTSLGHTFRGALEHHYGFQVYAFVIGFLVVLRTNHALARFMEARTSVELMGSKWWGDVYSYVCSGMKGRGF